jgi:two-component system CheB/CheR fusion protein
MVKSSARAKKSAAAGDVDKSSPAPYPTYYVALGASAGGLEAIESFFTHMPLDSGMGFVVVQHLSPDYKSLMVELLSKKTAMPVQRAEDGMQVMPNHVYLIPPKKNLTIFHGKLLLSEQEPHKGINLPIDVFLRSLAEDQSEKAVAVILSGTGSDGTRGVRAVKEYGGMVMVQDEESAKFDGMPRAATATGLVDFVLPPEKMPRQLLTFAQSPYCTKTERSESLLSDEEGLTRIFAILREKCKVDFTFYKPSTVTRRIERRMTINQAGEIKEYVAYLQRHPGEAMALYRELLIGVTNFFRDQEVFDRLAENELSELLRNAGPREIRFWVAGCSTGEEAYSLAIQARECMEALGVSRDIKIFATDIDRDAIHYAAAGIYPESIAADVSPKLLSKYFYRKEESFQIVRTIREMVVFAPHNLIKDPPFTNISLISCRNLLIYLQPVLQRKVLEGFNFSLLPGGVLLLGTSETTGEMADYFDTLDPKFKLYRSKGRFKPASGLLATLSTTDTRARDLRGRYAGVRRALRASEEERVLERFLDSAAPDYIPLALIVNEELEILQVVGDAAGYLKLPSGKLLNDISRLAAKELAVPLTTGIQKVFRQHEELRFSNIRLADEQGGKLARIHIKPLPAKKGQEPLVAVFIGEVKKAEPVGPGTVTTSYDLSKETEDRLRDLEQELQFSRENLQATIEELETSNEELQATNEELLASNEELQSTNEELQSTNEELFTVNSEYQSKIIELTELHHDVENLLSATQMGQLLLDENLEVRRFSKRMGEIFKLLDSDVGRPITHISHYFVDCDPLEAIRKAQASNLPVELEVCTQDSRRHLMRVVPYKVGPKSFSGTVVSFVDITRLKHMEASLRASEERFRQAVEEAPFPILIHAEDGCILTQNRAWTELSGYSPADIPTIADWTARAFGQQQQEAQDTIQKLYALKQRQREGEFVITCRNGSQRVWEFSAMALGSLPDGRRTAISMAVDVTLRKQAEQALRESQQLFASVANASPALVWMAGVDKACVWFNDPWLAFTGRTREQELGNGWAEGVHPEDFDRCLQTYVQAFDARKPFAMEYRLRRHDGQYRWLLDEGHPRQDASGQFAGYIGFCFDITERCRREQELLDVQKLSKMASFRWDVATNQVSWSSELFAILERAPDSFPHTPDAFIGFIHPEDQARVRSAVSEALASGKPLEVEYRFVMPDGRIKHIASHGQILFGADGRPPQSVLGFTQDISRRRHAELALQASEAECRKLQQALNRQGGTP